MPYATQRDRVPSNLELEKAPWPVPPINLFLMGGVQPGVMDLRWDDPAILSLNQGFDLVGVNIYRSFDSEYGPFERITSLPVGSGFWRDQTDNVLVVDEDVSDSFVLNGWGKDAAGLYAPRYVFRTARQPIVVPGSQAVPTSCPDDVVVMVDGVRAKILAVNGPAGEVELDGSAYPIVATQRREVPVVPRTGSVVTCSYRYCRSFLRTNLMQRVFYRVTTVGVPSQIGVNLASPADLVETPLERAAATSSREIEKLDWIWKEAVRRNRWILSQGGERVRLFIRRAVGFPCGCAQNVQYQQPLNDCKQCFGVGILGGYDGPYDLIIAPDDAERKIAQGATGRHVEHMYEVWAGPTPLLSQRDFIVKINGERYSIGPVRFPSNRGMVLQQHFNIGYLDELDIRYHVSLDSSARYSADQLGMVVPPDPVAGTFSTPEGITGKINIPNEREIRGRTVTWENIVYGVAPLMFLADPLVRLLVG